MILRALIYAIGVFALTALIALIVAGIILLLYKIVRRSETKNELAKLEAKSTPSEKAIPGKEGV